MSGNRRRRTAYIVRTTHCTLGSLRLRHRNVSLEGRGARERVEDEVSFGRSDTGRVRKEHYPNDDDETKGRVDTILKSQNPPAATQPNISPWRSLPISMPINPTSQLPGLTQLSPVFSSCTPTTRTSASARNSALSSLSPSEA